MSPMFRDGDFVMVSKIPIWLNGIQQDHVVVFQSEDYGIMIKSVDRKGEEDKIHFSGSHKNSVDSRRIGPVSPKDVIGEVILHISQNPHR